MDFIRCEKKDTARIIDFYDRVVKHLEETINYPKWSEMHPSSESLEEAIQSASQYALVENGRIFGAVILNEDPEGAYEVGEWGQSLEPGEYLVIHLLATEPSVERRGIGDALVNHCLEFARHAGYKAVRLDVVPDNVPAIKLYEKHGFLFAGQKDLMRNIEGIPEFGLYEKKL